jgi:hypothetical protein
MTAWVLDNATLGNQGIQGGGGPMRIFLKVLLPPGFAADFLSRKEAIGVLP